MMSRHWAEELSAECRIGEFVYWMDEFSNSKWSWKERWVMIREVASDKPPPQKMNARSSQKLSDDGRKALLLKNKSSPQIHSVKLPNLLQIMIQTLRNLMKCAVHKDPPTSTDWTFRLEILDDVGTIYDEPCVIDGEETEWCNDNYEN